MQCPPTRATHRVQQYLNRLAVAEGKGACVLLVGVGSSLMQEGQAANPPLEHAIDDTAAVDTQTPSYAATLPPGDPALNE